MSDTTISEAYSFTRTEAAVDEWMLQSGWGGAVRRRSGAAHQATKPGAGAGLFSA